jgi:hypothetical protein
MKPPPMRACSHVVTGCKGIAVVACEMDGTAPVPPSGGDRMVGRVIINVWRSDAVLRVVRLALVSDARV